MKQRKKRTLKTINLEFHHRTEVKKNQAFRSRKDAKEEILAESLIGEVETETENGGIMKSCIKKH